MSALESVSLAASVPGLGCDIAVAVEFEFINRADEWTALIAGHSLRPPLFLLSCALRPPIIDDGKPGGIVCCWVISETEPLEA